MLRNYFLVAVRNLLRNRVVSAINIAGLSIGLACCMLIFLYAKDERAAAFTIFISCIGLLGLTMLAAERRTKEIGIRKVLGASIGSLVCELSISFLGLVLLANIIAIPFAWWAVNKWLDNFAYHITPRWWVFATATGISLLIAMSTVAMQAARAASSSPVRNLRSE